jgi:hypothetical protein
MTSEDIFVIVVAVCALIFIVTAAGVYYGVGTIKDEEQLHVKKERYRGKRRRNGVLNRLRSWVPYPIHIFIPGQHK